MPLCCACHFVLVAFRHPAAKAEPDILVKCYNLLETLKPREYATAMEALTTFIKSRWTRIRSMLFDDCPCPQQKGADCGGCEALRNAALLVDHPE